MRSLTTVAVLCFGLAVVALTSSAHLTVSAADWPQWRGPDRNGTSKESGLLKQWPAGGPKLLWQVNDIGDGYSTPAVVGNAHLRDEQSRGWRTSLFRPSQLRMEKLSGPRASAT